MRRIEKPKPSQIGRTAYFLMAGYLIFGIEAQLPGHRCGFSPRPDLEFAENGGDVVSDRAW